MVERKADVDFPAEFVEEGEVKILVPRLKAFVKAPSDYAPSKAPVFYNPVMELNRDMAVLALRAYQKRLGREISVCEPLTGCGARGIRFAAEVKGVKKVVIGDINERAFKLARYNVRVNGLSGRVVVNHEEVNRLLSRYSAPRRRFDVIDVDPFGSPVPYMDSAVRALRDGGMLALTATDMAPLCGVHPKACIRKYGGKPLRTEYCHELAVRLLAGCLAMTAARQEIGVSVVFSHSTDHYLRVYATVKHGAKEADESIKDMGYVLHCFGCLHRETVRGLFAISHSGRCPECGSKLTAAGPLWLGKILNEEFCESMEEEARKSQYRLGGKVRKILALLKSEVDSPMSYYVVDKLCDMLNLPMPPVRKVVEALRKEEGCQVSLTHFSATGIKSDASSTKIREILLELTGNDR